MDLAFLLRGGRGEDKLEKELRAMRWEKRHKYIVRKLIHRECLLFFEDGS